MVERVSGRSLKIALACGLTMNVVAFLKGFVKTHQGVRFGCLFGEPAAFVGRRVFARINKDRLLCCSVSVSSRSVVRRRRVGRDGGWVPVATDTSTDQLVAVLERAAAAIAATVDRNVAS
jgi:hypothetical protein